MSTTTSSNQLSRRDLETPVFRAVDKVNELLPATQKLEKSRATVLLDEGTSLDSLSVINLLVFVEDEINSTFDTQVTLTDDDDTGGLPSEALRTLGDLIDALDSLMTSVA
jgi:acyl carrier protein